MSFFHVNENCNGCLACVQNCPACALKYEDEDGTRRIFHSMTRCARCGHCWRICPQDAIVFEELIYGGWDLTATFEIRRCRICGEPIYTPAFAEALNQKVDAAADDLCPVHRQQNATAGWRRAAAGVCAGAKEMKR